MTKLQDKITNLYNEIKKNKKRTSEEQLLLVMEWFNTKMYLSILSQNIQRSLKSCWKKGIWTNKAPIGYLNTRDAEGKPDITVDADRLYKILQLFLRRRDGFTIAELEWLAKQMNLTYSSSKPVVINKRKILQILKNPFYAGDMLIKGELYHHNYPILVGKEIFDAVQKKF